MTAASEIFGLRAHIAKLESRVDFLYNHLGFAHVKDTGMAEARAIEALRRRNKIER